MAELIIDSGSTKADWALIQDDHVSYLETKGYNPYLHSAYLYYKSHISKIEQFLGKTFIKKLTCFSAGADNTAQKANITELYQNITHAQEVHVFDDLEALRLILYPQSTGIISILGTGSFSAYVKDGKLCRKLIPPAIYVMMKGVHTISGEPF